ncbi:MAG: hypothetical protein LBT89_04620 [Planctomycetaceae bacterium]|nr:hypothetical protein [Planctomycetaceae bacterium]
MRIFDEKTHKPLEVKFSDLCEEDKEYVNGQSNPFQVNDPKEVAKKKEAEANFVKIDWNTPTEVMQVQAEMGNADACAWLGFLYEEGLKGLTADANNAKFCYEKGAKLAAGGSLGAGFCMAKLTKDQNEYEKAAEQGFVLAGLYVIRDKNRAKVTIIIGESKKGLSGMDLSKMDIPFVKKAAETDIPIAQRLLGKYYEAEKQYDAANVWYRKAAEQGDGNSSLTLAQKYFDGNGGCKQDKFEGLRWFNRGGMSKDQLQRVIVGDGEASEIINGIRKRAEEGDADFQNILGDCYFYGVGGPKKNSEKAVEWYMKSAAAGNPVAFNDLGDCYWEGNGVTQDKSKALEYYHKAAEKGYYTKSSKVAKRAAFGFDKLRNLADRGTAEDKYKLGMRFLYGDKDVPQDKQEAIVWLQKAAHTDDSQWAADAAYRLGDLIEENKGFFAKMFSFQNDKRYWTNLAASKGHGSARAWVQHDDTQRQENAEQGKRIFEMEEALRRSRR